MSIINKNLLGILFSGATVVLASASWKNNVRTIYGINSSGTGYTSFKPTSNFNSLTQLVADGVYILDVATPGFELPGAVLAAGAPPSVAAVINKALVGFLYGGASPLVLASAPFKNSIGILYGFNAGGNGYTSFKPTSNFNSLTQLVPDAAYILSSTGAGFSLPGAVLAVVAAATTPLQGRMAVAVGDSLTAGYTLPNPAAQAFPAVLAGLVPAYSSVVNKGVSGNTVQDMTNRLAGITAAYDLTTGVDVFLLAGVNNFGHTTDTVQNVLDQYATLIAGLKAPAPAKVRVFLLTLPAANWAGNAGGTVAGTTAKVNDLNAAIRLQATALGATDFIDLARRVETQNPTDGTYYSDQLHDTPAGAAVKANTIADYVLHGTQPSGPVLANTVTPPAATGTPPAGFAGWVAPDSGESTEYDVDANWVRTGTWRDYSSTLAWLDGHGVYTVDAGATIETPPANFFAKSVRALLTTWSNGGTAQLDMIRVSDSQVVATQTLSLRGTNGPPFDVLLTAPSLDVYKLRLTAVSPNGFLSGVQISR